MQVLVRDNNIDQALRSYEKPSEKRVREKAEAVRRTRKAARKQAQREGLLPAPKRKPLVARPPRPGA
jgi:small subunit ribosomal protein S21